MPGYPGTVSWIRRNGREIFLKNGWGSPWDTILNEPVPRLIRMLVCDCFLCPIGGQYLSRRFRDPLIWRSLPENSAVRRIRLARAGKLSPRWVFSKMHQLRTSDWELIKGKFVNTSESTSRSVLGLFVQLCKSTPTVSFHPLVSLRWKIYKL